MPASSDATLAEAGLTTGGRIREWRQERGLLQAELAAAAGISASYLNLIEHNRRRIAGKLLHDIARALDLDPARLSEATGSAEVAALRAVGAAGGLSRAEIDRAGDLSQRYPGWAALIAAQAAEAERLSLRLQEHSDRLSHDPDFAAALHEMLTAVTAIHSTSGILVESPDLDRDWQDRFFRNIHADSAKLSAASRALFQQLDLDPGGIGAPADPAQEVDAILAAAGPELAALEEGADPAAVAARLAGGAPAALHRALARALGRRAADIRALPLAGFRRAAARADFDPLRLATETGAPFAQILRRLAGLPPAPGQPVMALVEIDGAGAILAQKAEGGLDLPRGGRACPLWPVYAALTQPGRPLRAAVALPGVGGAAFLTYSLAEAGDPPAWDAPAPLRATMLAQRRETPAGMTAWPVGAGCRVCPRQGCAARRAPSALTALGAQGAP